MTLYESNYIRLGWLVADVAALADRSLSRVAHDCPLEITVMDRARFTTTLTMSYLFEEAGVTVRDPGLEVRVYHDARLAEAASLQHTGRHPALRRLQPDLPATAGSRWAANMLLNKWLEYCVDRGHRFEPGRA